MTSQEKKVPQQKLFLAVILLLFTLFLFFGDTIVGRFLGWERFFGSNSDTSTVYQEIAIPPDRRDSSYFSEENILQQDDSGGETLSPLQRVQSPVGDDRYSSGRDCTAAGGATAHTEPLGSRGCQIAVKKACDAAKAKAKADHEADCRRDCADAGKMFERLRCLCPLVGAHPVTDEQYVCWTITTGPSGNPVCTASVVARCDCECKSTREEQQDAGTSER